MEPMRLVNEIMKSFDSMIDPHADIEQRVAQMRAQLAAMSQLPQLIQQKMEAMSQQINQFSQMETFKEFHQERIVQTAQPGVEFKEIIHPIQPAEEEAHSVEITEIETPEKERYIEIQKPFEYNRNEPESPSIRLTKASLTEEELGVFKKEEIKKMEESVNMEKQKEITHQINIEQPPTPTYQPSKVPSTPTYQPPQVPQTPIYQPPQVPLSPIYQTPQMPTRSRSPSPRPQPVFGPAPKENPLPVQGIRKWKKSHEEYNEELIQETLTAQAEVIKGRAIGVNFMKYEKPPPALNHLQNSEVYKLIHNADETPVKKVEMLRPVIAEADYRERARSMSPCPNGR